MRDEDISRIADNERRWSHMPGFGTEGRAAREGGMIKLVTMDCRKKEACDNFEETTWVLLTPLDRY